MQYNQNPLFTDITSKDCLKMLNCFHSEEKLFSSGEMIHHFSSQKPVMGILLSGTASVLRYEFNGSRTILEKLEPNSVFGEILAFHSEEYENIHLKCDTECRVLMIDYESLMKPCTNACACHTRLIQNVTWLISKKTMSLSQRVEVLSKRTIREKLYCYFMQESLRQKSSSFCIPFTMSDLADYLSVDRSAMMRELKKMKEDGILSSEKRMVRLLPEHTAGV